MESVTIPKDKYNELLFKADLFEKFVETEELNEKELSQVKEALKGNFFSKEEFLSKHHELV